jgi:hypothetical protein
MEKLERDPSLTPETLTIYPENTPYVDVGRELAGWAVQRAADAGSAGTIALAKRLHDYFSRRPFSKKPSASSDRE